MNVIEAILDLAVVLLWLQWRSVRTAQPALPGKSLIALLQPTDKPRASARLLLFLAGLVLIRTLFYWQIGSPLRWVPSLAFGTTTVPFRSDFFGLMALYSLLSAAQSVVVMYFWLLLLSVINHRVADTEPFQKWLRLHLGRLENLPLWARLLLPMAVTALAWLVLGPLFIWLQLLPKPISPLRFLGEAAVVGLGACLAWKFLVIGTLLLGVLNSYIYFGDHPFWSFVETTNRNLLGPLRRLPLRLYRLDLAPIAALLLVWGAVWLVSHPLYGLPGLATKLAHRDASISATSTGRR